MGTILHIYIIVYALNRCYQLHGLNELKCIINILEFSLMQFEYMSNHLNRFRYA